MLYMGYVGFSVAFAFAIAALLAGRLDATWARWSRPWTIAAWIFLTLGIALGSYWAYYELGWGGWWFWDPVENASFMPWLVGTALIHSLAVTEKRGAFKSWTVLLAITAFSLQLLGTFLVRSGVLTSVHAFATDPRRGVFILALLTLVIGGSLVLFALRAPRSRRPAAQFALGVARDRCCSRTTCCWSWPRRSVLLGTLYPLVIDALGLGKLSVGPPYFNAVFVPLMAPLLFLVATGPLARWKEASRARDRAAARGGPPRSRSRPASPCRSRSAAGSRSRRSAWRSRPGSPARPPSNVRERIATLGRCASRARGTACTSRTSASRCSSPA